MNEINEVVIFLIFWVFVLGLCIGSFLNVVILRGLSEESIVFPSSKCPKCGNKLKWWMNIPVLSYLFLRGKCFYCKEKISIQYPIVELVTGIFFVCIFLQFSISITTLFYMIAASMLIVMSVCDFRENVIIDLHAYILIFFGILYNTITGSINGFIFAVIGAIAGFILYEIIARVGYIFAGQRAFGEGDSLIAAGIGAFFGWQWLLVSVVLSVILMSIFSLPYFLYHSYKVGKKKSLFAILIAIAAIITLLIVTKFELIQDDLFLLLFLISIVLIAIWCVAQILIDMKTKSEENKDSFCVLPFGPAMGASFLAIMFFAPQIENFIKSYLGQM